MFIQGAFERLESDVTLQSTVSIGKMLRHPCQRCRPLTPFRRLWNHIGFGSSWSAGAYRRHVGSYPSGPRPTHRPANSFWDAIGVRSSLIWDILLPVDWPTTALNLFLSLTLKHNLSVNIQLFYPLAWRETYRRADTQLVGSITSAGPCKHFLGFHEPFTLTSTQLTPWLTSQMG